MAIHIHVIQEFTLSIRNIIDHIQHDTKTKLGVNENKHRILKPMGRNDTITQCGIYVTIILHIKE